MNSLIITDNYIDFSNFEGISNKITICLFPERIIILNGEIKQNYGEHPYILDATYKLYSTDMVDILRERNINNTTTFSKIKNTFYQD